MNNFLAQSQVARFMVIVVGCVAIVAAMRATASILTPISARRRGRVAGS